MRKELREEGLRRSCGENEPDIGENLKERREKKTRKRKNEKQKN
jgi:hypothetical protein